MKMLLIIDLQNQFINENTKSSINDIEYLINSKMYDRICFTKFVNSIDNPTYKFLGWTGCLTEQSRDICINTKDNKVFEKNTYSAFNNELIEYIEKNNIDEIYLCGIDIECCVLATAYNLFENGYNVKVIKDYCYSMYGDNCKQNAIGILERNIGKNNIQ